MEKVIKIQSGNSSSYYFIDGGKYYVRHSIWSDKLGIHVNSSKKRISKESYERMAQAHGI